MNTTTFRVELVFVNTGAYVHSGVGVFAAQSNPAKQRDDSGKEKRKGGLEGKEG